MPTYQQLLKAAYDRTDPKDEARADIATKKVCAPYLNAAEADLKERWPQGYVGHQLASCAYDRIKYPEYYDNNLKRKSDELIP